MNIITLPSNFEGFVNTKTTYSLTDTQKKVLIIEGYLEHDEDIICPNCGHKMHVHDNYNVGLKSIPYEGDFTVVSVTKKRYECPVCAKKKMQEVLFQAKGHRITKQLYDYIVKLLALGLTNKHVASLTGVGKNVVKEIDKERLRDKYCDNEGNWTRPLAKSKAIGIDEFLLHEGHQYATVIVDLVTGYVLYLALGKKKQVVYDFIEFVGKEWMKGVEVVCCDMNSDFQEAFVEKCPHIKICYDYFHIKKYLNDKVISAIRKDEYSRLLKEGKTDEAKSLKKSRLILTSSLSTLEKGPEWKKEKYRQIISENELLFTTDIAKEKLSYAYTLNDEASMEKELNELISICRDANNKHFTRFANLLENHFDGLITHATYHLSSGKVEGINNKIKTIRRQAYGYPDDDYFFLKIFDASRQYKKVNHKITQVS